MNTATLTATRCNTRCNTRGNTHYNTQLYLLHLGDENWRHHDSLQSVLKSQLHSDFLQESE